MIKKIICFIATLIICLALFCGCNKETDANASDDKAAIQAAENKDADIGEVLQKEEIKMEYKDMESGFNCLLHAYACGALKQNDLKSIAYYRAGRVGNESIMDEDFTPIPKSPEVLDAETVEKMKKDWVDFQIDKGYISQAPEFGVQVDSYYGTYNDCVVVVMGYVNGIYAAAVSQEIIEGVKFYYRELSMYLYMEKINE